MGACASKFSVLKNSADASPLVPQEEQASREVNVVEETVVKKDDGLPVAANDEAKHQSLGRLFKEVKSNEGEKGSAESNRKASEEFTQENETDKSSKSEKAVDGKPAIENVEMEVKKVEEMEVKKVEEKPVDTVKLGTSEKVEMVETEKPEENKLVEVPSNDKKPETPEMVETEGRKLASDAEKKEEKPTENKTLEKKPEAPETKKTEEQKPASDVETKTEEKPDESIKIEASDKMEDKHVFEPAKTEECLDKKADEESVTKPETPEVSADEQKPASSVEKAEEGKTIK